MKQVLIQHNAITQARCEMTALEKNIVYLLMAKLKEGDLPGKVYSVAVRELKKVTGKDIDHIQFKKTTDKLVEKVLYVNYGKKGNLRLNMLSSGKYREGQGMIELELSKEMRAFFFALKNNFTTFQFKVALSLKSKYAKRMYEMLSQYKDTRIMRITLAELKDRLNLRDVAGRKEKYTEFGLFRKNVLEVAKDELDEKGDISFSYEAIKTGRKYTHLTFKIKRIPRLLEQTAANNKLTDEEKIVFVRLTKRYILSDWQADRIIKQVPLSKINKTIYEVQLEVANRKVRNVGGYTAKIFDDKYRLDLFKNRKK